MNSTIKIGLPLKLKWVLVSFSKFTTITPNHMGDAWGPKLRRRRTLFPLPLPKCSIAEAKGPDMDFINVAYSNLIHAHWDLLTQIASALTPFRVSHVLLKTHRDHFLARQFFNWAGQQSGFTHSIESHCLMFHILTRANKFKAAEALMKRVIAPKVGNPGSEIFQTLVNTYRLCDSTPRVFDALFMTYAHSNKLRNARDVFCWMKSYGILPTTESCNAYCSSLLKRNRHDIVCHFYGEMLLSGISPNVYTLNMAIHAFCKIGKLQKAGDVFLGMEELGCSPNVVSINVMINGYCKNGLVTSALKLMREMAVKGLVPDIVTYNALIHGLCKEEKVHDANKLFYEMQRMGLSPNTVTYNILINAYGDQNDIEMAFRLYEEMIQKGVQLNVLTYNALIRSLCKAGKMRKANYFLKEMAAKKFEANPSTFYALIDGYCRRKNIEQAFQLYEKMVKKGFTPNATIFKALITGLCEDGDLQEGVKTLEEMVSRGLVPDAEIFYALIQGFRKRGKIKDTMKFPVELQTKV